MEKQQRSKLQTATQDARKLLEEEFRSQLLQTYDIDVEKVRWAEAPGAHLQAEQRLIRDKLVAWIEHKEAQINDRKEALLLALREMAFTALNRFVALKLMEARELVRPCVSGGLESAGFLEFTAMAQGLLADQESSYRLYLETIFEDVSRELRALFNPRDSASLLWPKRTALLELLEILNRPELAELWIEDETLGWVYQYFNGDAERKKMREESSAPRNSRELAVRNQFFTPRYVVEFLTDNTLGRIWYEMRQGNTGLKDRCRYLVRRTTEVWLQPGEEPPAQPDTDEALSQDELLRQPVYIPYRPLKDPREIRILDPACGSMHFGLYAFDLYLAIYEEAWEIASRGSDEQAKQEEALSSFVAYAVDFADKAAFLREIPKLILQHNIHGIDIDSRATQIARLTLWLRAQRAWQEQHLQVADRPVISRSNVVCAEPMPGERELLVEFIDQQFPETEKELVQQFLEVIIGQMRLAGEAGSLLKIEEEIHDAIDKARREWQKLAVHQSDLFSANELAALGQAGSSLAADFQSLTKDFWATIEERIYTALRDYASQFGIGGYQRQLFAEDTVQGFAYIDVCRKSYDVVLANPPFGSVPGQVSDYIAKKFPVTYYDVYSSFVERGFCKLSQGGRFGGITSKTFFAGSRMREFRRWLIHDAGLEQCADLGMGVLDDATVETACYVMTKTNTTSFVRFYDLLKTDSRADALSEATSGRGAGCYAVARKTITEFPNCSFSAYWASTSLLSIFKRFPALDPEFAETAAGQMTGDDFRFVRSRWEIAQESFGGWHTFAKGGEFFRYYCDWHLLIDWTDAALEKYRKQTVRSVLLSRRSSEFADRKALAWNRVNEIGFNVRALPINSKFSDKAPAVFPGSEPLALLGLLCSRMADRLCALQNPNRMFEVRDVSSIPVPTFDGSCVSDIVREIIEIKQRWSSFVEPSSVFCSPLTFFANDALPGASCGPALGHLKADSRRLLELQSKIDSLVEAAYQVTEEDLALALNVLGDVPVEKVHEESAAMVEDRFWSFQGVQYCLGVAFGRWDVRYATGEQSLPKFHDPFKPLPICPPGQLQNVHGLPVCSEDVPTAYPVRIPWDGILVDDSNHPLDLELRIREVIEIIWSGQEDSPSAEAIEIEACEILGVSCLRECFRKPAGFFANHLKCYSKSRRQAPIYWQLSAGNSSYSAWLYYHRFTQDTLYRVLRDFVEPRIQQAERDQFELESQGSLSVEAVIRLQEAQTLLQDLQILKSELDLVAPLWNPNLNDGVIINHAILWRITPFTPWQKKCKECWDKLVKGDYDWAHLAFHLWPERVIPKCTTDRSLAIAHGLEERLWQETNNGNWLPRQLSEADLQALIAEHSNPALKSALERFLAAPPPVAPTRTRASRSTRGSGSSIPRRASGSAAVVDAEASRQVLLALSAAPSDGLAKAAIADLIGVEANALTAVIKQLKESGQIEQLGERRGARYVLSEQGRAAVASQTGEDD